ncbi:MAG: anhydro-N-acetylmuramic acid kinase [Flavobacterium sp.]
MLKNSYHVVGVMSGTSLDGIDLAEIFLEYKEHQWSFALGHTSTIPYDESWLTKLREAIHYKPNQLELLNKAYTEHLAKIINEFINQHQINNLDAVCSHGHTILHQPHLGLTFQIGNLPQIAEYLNKKVVCDFRVQDVKLGGQGAPLVPIGDQLLFHEMDYCLNLGGFANISFEENGKRIAFDICPVNTILNYWAEKKGLPFDRDGIWASEGTLNPELLEKLNRLPFYHAPYPKSLGVEFLNAEIFPSLSEFNLSPEDHLRTFCEHIAIQISRVVPDSSIRFLITGGGAYNHFLIERIKKRLPNASIIIPDSKVIEFKEALIFGLLGVLKLRNEVNVLSSVTGAKMDHSSGVIYS